MGFYVPRSDSDDPASSQDSEDADDADEVDSAYAADRTAAAEEPAAFERDNRQADIDGQPIICRRYGAGAVYSNQRAAAAAAAIRPTSLPHHPVWPLRGPPPPNETAGSLSR